MKLNITFDEEDLINYDESRKKVCWIIVGLLAVYFLPFLGLTDFNTRGEPREAIVALSMLDSFNWILPTNSGDEIAFKPPFFHWCISIFSLFTGGVNEYTSRLPSAVATIVMTAMLFMFYSKRGKMLPAILIAAITVTNFEVHRASVNCRVDMVMTALMVIAMLELFKWHEEDCEYIPVASILLLTAAILTKGPVGVLLPCLVMFVYDLVKGENVVFAFTRYFAVGLAASMLASLWYVAAYYLGGDKFLALVIEENILRFIGKMSYTSHENPAWYNVVTVVAGYLPFTILGVISLFFLKYGKKKKADKIYNDNAPKTWQTWKKRMQNYISDTDDTKIFSFLSMTLIFIFYCIPKSKRSVYLLPIYPFIAYFLAHYIIYLWHRHRNALKTYGGILGVLGIILSVAFVAVKCGFEPNMGSGRHAAQNMAMLAALRDTPINLWVVIIAALPAVAGVWTLVAMRKKNMALIAGIFATTASIFFSLDGLYQPRVLNVKSDKPVAEYLLKKYGPNTTFYSHIVTTPGNPMQFFTIGFYLDNKVKPFKGNDPFMVDEGLLLVGERDYKESFLPKWSKDYNVTLVKDFKHRTCDFSQNILLCKFVKKPKPKKRTESYGERLYRQYIRERLRLRMRL